VNASPSSVVFIGTFCFISEFSYVVMVATVNSRKYSAAYLCLNGAVIFVNPNTVALWYNALH
ncbi:MAG: hypothetical protein ACI4SO_02390, partial [Muribaculaceae bacterium]